MNENRRQILEMLSTGKITSDQAERLIAALESGPAATAGERMGSIPGPNGAAAGAVKTPAKYLRILVEADEQTTGKKGPTSVNVRVPMQLLRAGVRLASIIPAHAHSQFDEALNRHGVPLTLSQIKPENLEELIDHLEDLTIDVDARDEGTTKVRVFCE